MELTYWILFAWRNHSAVKGLLDIYKELQTKKGSLSFSGSSIAYINSRVQTPVSSNEG